MCGSYAVSAAISGESGKMICVCREPGNEYKINFECIDIGSVANGEKKVPLSFINDSGIDVSEDFIDYAYRLICGECNVIYEKGIPKYIKR